MGRNSKEYELAIKIAGKIEKSFYTSTSLTKKELSAIAKHATQTSESMSVVFSKGLKDAAPVFESLSSAGAAAFEAITTAATVAAIAVAAVTAASVAVGASFEAQMSTVKAISGASAADFEKLNDLAKELGASTQYTATEVGEAMEYMAMAGWKTEDMLAGMAGVLNLAASSGEDLATTSDIVTDAMTAFGMGADEVNHFADVLAAAATNSNTNVSMMGETFKYAASLAGAMGYSIEDVSVAIGLMANSGIKGSSAGTALRKIFAETTSGATTASAALGEYTIETQNADGSMRDLQAIIGDLRYAFSQMTESEKAANAEAIAGKTAMSGLLAIVNASEADYQKLTGAVYDCAGAAQEMAEIRLDNLSGDVEIFKSELEGLGIQIYEDLNEPLRVGTQAATEIIGEFSQGLSETGFVADLTAKIPTAIRKIKELSTAVKDFSEPFFAVGGWLIDNPGVITGAIASVGTAIATYKVASGIMSIVKALGSLGPVGMGILAIGAVAGVITGIATAVKKSAVEAKKANLAAHFGNISLSLSELDEVASGIVSSGSLTAVREAMAEFEKLDDIQREIDDVTASINKTNWKVSIGLELSEEEQEAYRSNIATYVEQCQEYVEQQQYAVNLAVGVLTDDDLEGQNIVAQVNSFYADKQDELASLGTELNNAITEAFQDGLLDMDEAQRIADIQAQMAEIQAQLAGANFDAELEALSLNYGGELDAESFMNLQAELAEKVEAAKADYQEAFTSATASALAMLQDGEIDQARYDSMVAEYKENYLEQIGEIELKASNFQTDTLMNQYAEELEAAVPELQRITDEAFMNEYEWETNPFYFQALQGMITDSEALDEDTKAAMAELYEQLAPSVEQMEALAAQYREAGEEIPAALMEGINNAALIGTLSGDEDAFWSYIGAQINDNEEYQAMVETAKECAGEIPEEVATAIDNNQHIAVEAVDNLYQATQEGLTSAFGAGFDITAEVRINMTPAIDSTEVSAVASSTDMTLGARMRNNMIPLDGHAEGGIFNTPHIAWFAEKGPEAAIPLDGSQNAIDLWTETGRLLGVDGMSNDTESGIAGLSKSIAGATTENQMPEINYKPTLQFYGDAPKKEDIDDALKMSEERFEEMLDRYMRQKYRLSFS